MNKRFGETPELHTSDSVQLSDTVLHSGEQTLRVSLAPARKADIARALNHAEVNYIETGSACTDSGEREAIKRVTSPGFGAAVTSFARGVKNDVDLALDRDVDSITLAVPASDRRAESKVEATREDVVETTDKLVAYAKDHGLWVEIIGEDGSRAVPEFLESLTRAGHDAGADRFCFADTVGHTSPEHTYEVVSRLSGLGPTSTHTHDGFGLAMASVHASLATDADLIHTTVNGVGERAGSATLEGVAIALDHYYDVEPMRPDELYTLARKVTQTAGASLPPNKAVIGQSAFTHESGIHTDGTLKDDAMYEPYPPGTIGRERRLVLGKHAERAGVKATLDEHGVDATDEEVTAVVKRVRELGDRGKRVTDANLLTSAEDVQGREHTRQVELLGLMAAPGGGTPAASVRLHVGGEKRVASGARSGPVGAAVKAVRKALDPGASAQLDEYHADAITDGTDAVVTVEMAMSLGNRSVSVAAPRADIVRVSVQAMVDALG